MKQQDNTIKHVLVQEQNHLHQLPTRNQHVESAYVLCGVVFDPCLTTVDRTLPHI
jgi:hypothetical protein